MANPIILALDIPDLARALSLAKELRALVGCFKVGLELFTACGVPAVLETFAAEGLSVFADVKFSDIPNTVAAATNALTLHPLKFFDVHASCGQESMRAAAQKKRGAKLLAVTVLTSIPISECEIIFGSAPDRKVVDLARMALQAGADGIVCSPLELKILATIAELDKMIRVTPGVRPHWAEAGDQKRALSPKEAMELGANYLVIGRPITSPPQGMSPKEAAEKILAEIEGNQ